VATTALAGVLLGACSEDGSEGDLAAFCDAAADQQRFETVFDTLDPTDVEGALATFRQARTTQASLRDLAPAAARADIDIVLGFVDDLIDGLEPAQREPAVERPDVYTSLRPRFDEVEAAGDRLRVYVETNC